jgi:peptide-methionine (R)-S-oxide reductase
MRKISAFAFTFVLLAGCTPASAPQEPTAGSGSSSNAATMIASLKAAMKPECYPGSCGIPPMTDDEVKKVLSPAAYKVMREADTERPYSSPLNDEHRAGTFVAADTGEPLFRSETKFDSGTGWPSFYAPISIDNLVVKTDTLLGYERTEVLTRNGSHLGHVFTDGPEPTGLRYCMNGLALRFIPDEK